MIRSSLERGQTAALIVVLTTSFLTSYTFTSVNLAIPSISHDFGVRATQINWIVAAYMLTVAALSIPFGRLADFWGRKKIMDMGLVVYSMATLLIAFSGSVEVLIALRAVQGIGGAMIMSTNTALLVAAYPQSKRGTILGYNIGLVYAGQATGPVLGGFLTHNFGWHSVFISMAACGFLALALSLICLRNGKTPQQEREKATLDLPGIGLLVPGILLFMYGLSEIASSRFARIVLALGLVSLVLFVRHERHTVNPVLDIRLFKNTNFVLSNLASLFNFGATFAVGYYLSIYLQMIKGYDAQTAGFILISQPIIIAILSLFAGRLSDKYSPFLIASTGMGLCTVSLILFAQLTVSTALPFIFVSLLIVGLGFGCFSPANNNAIMSTVPPKQMNAASSMLPTMRQLGNASSMAIISFLTTFKLGTASYEEASKAILMETIHVSFIVFAVICAVGVVISLQRKTQH